MNDPSFIHDYYLIGMIGLGILGLMVMVGGLFILRMQASRDRLPQPTMPCDIPRVPSGGCTPSGVRGNLDRPCTWHRFYP